MTIPCRGACNGTGTIEIPNGKGAMSVSGPDGLYDDAPCPDCGGEATEACRGCGEAPATMVDSTGWAYCASCGEEETP